MELGGDASFNLGSGFLIHDDPDMDHLAGDDDDDDELGACSDSSSSVGSRSDSSDEEEESSHKEPLKTTDASERMLPVTVRRGISKFYNGKSKSFTSLADAVSSASVKEFAKPETLYSKKQNNLLARKIPDSKQVNSSRINPGGPFKNSSPSTYGNRNSLDKSCSSSASPPFCLPPLHPQPQKIQSPGSSVSPPRQKCFQWRSLSVSDLQGMVHNA